jgi:hypothetical protein
MVSILSPQPECSSCGKYQVSFQSTSTSNSINRPELVLSCPSFLGFSHGSRRHCIWTYKKAQARSDHWPACEGSQGLWPSVCIRAPPQVLGVSRAPAGLSLPIIVIIELLLRKINLAMVPLY